MHLLIDGRTIKKHPSGLGVWNLQLVRFLLTNKDVRIYLLLSQNCNYNFDLDSNFTPYLRKSLFLIKANHDYKFVSLDRFLFEIFTLPKLINKYKINFYHATDSFGIPFLLTTKVKTILTIHDLIPLTPSREYLNKWQLLIYKISLYSSVKRADKICAISEQTLMDIKKYLNVPNQKTKIIYDGVDPVFSHPQKQLQQAFILLAKKYNISPKKYLLYYGGFGSRRNVPLLIKSFAQLVKKYRLKELKLVLSGRITNAKNEALANLQEIISLTKELEINEQIVFMDYLAPIDKEVLVKNCLFFIALSGYEGFGLGPLEAIKYQVPIISSKPGILFSFKEPNFYLIDLDLLNIENVVSKMKLLVDGVSNKTDFKALINFTSQFSWEKMANEYYRLYQKLSND